MQISKSLESNGLVKKLSVWQSLNISQKTVPYSCLWWLLCCFSVKTCCPYHQLTAIGMTIHSDSGILTNTLPQLREWIAATPNQTLEGLQVIFKLECSHSESTQYEAYCAHWTQQTLPQKYRNIGPQMKTLILSHTVSRRYAKNNESFIHFRFYYFLECTGPIGPVYNRNCLSSVAFHLSRSDSDLGWRANSNGILPAKLSILRVTPKHTRCM